MHHAFENESKNVHRIGGHGGLEYWHGPLKICNYSKVSYKRTVFNNRTGGDLILQKVKSARALDFSHSLGPRDSKKSKFSHLEIYLVVLEQLTGL